MVPRNGRHVEPDPMVERMAELVARGAREKNPDRDGRILGGAALGIRERLRRLEERAESEVIVIPQHDGTVARFPEEAAKDAFVNLMSRLGAGEDAPPEHPMIGAVRNSSDAKWSGTVWDAGEPDGWTAPVPDLSEPGP